MMLAACRVCPLAKSLPVAPCTPAVRLHDPSCGAGGHPDYWMVALANTNYTRAGALRCVWQADGSPHRVA